MKYLTILGCISTFVLCYVPYGPLFTCGNVICMCLTVLYLRTYKKSKSFEVDPFIDGLINKKLGILFLIGMLGAGVLHCVYFIWTFNKYPLTEDITREELDAKIQSGKREKQLKKIGI